MDKASVTYYGENEVQFNAPGGAFITTIDCDALVEATRSAIDLANEDTMPTVDIAISNDGYWKVVVHKRFECPPTYILKVFPQYEDRLDTLPSGARQKWYKVDRETLYYYMVIRRRDGEIHG